MIKQFNGFKKKKNRYLLVRGGTDVYPEGLAARFKFIRNGDVVAEHAVTGHFHSHDARQYGSGVDADPHLEITGKKAELHCVRIGIRTRGRFPAGP